MTNVNGDVVFYTYDEYDNKTSMTYPDGRNDADVFLEIKNNPIEFRLFDLVYLNYEDDDAHVMLITGFDEKGEPLLSGNTNDRIALPFEDAVKTYDDVRIVRINMP